MSTGSNLAVFEILIILDSLSLCMSNEKSREVFISSARTSWIKFMLAGLAWKATRGNPIPYVGYLPGANKLAMWAFKVRVMSRDFE